MKTRKFKIATWFIEDELCHKVSISYDHETERAYQLLDIIYSKLEYDRRRKSLAEAKGVEFRPR